MTPQDTFIAEPTDADFRAALGPDAPRVEAPEGVHQRREGDATVTAAWWTNARGRAWLRVSRTAGGVLWVTTDDPRPPFWHVAPGRVFRVTKDGESRWLTACACGEVGTPESTLWMGDRCGACHDRREEGDPTLPADVPAYHAFSSYLGPIAMGPAGVVYVSAESRLYRIDPIGRRDPLSLPDGVPPSQLRVLVPSACGGFLAAGSGDRQRLVVFDTTSGTSDVLATGPNDPCRPSFSPDGSRLFTTHARGGCRMWHRSPDGWEAGTETLPSAESLAVSPDGGRIFLAVPDGVVELDTTTQAQRRLEPSLVDTRPDFVACTPEGRLVVLGGWRKADMLAYVRRLGPRPTPVAEASIMTLNAPALTPCGTYLAGVANGDLAFFRTADLTLAATVGLGVPIHPSRSSFAPDVGSAVAAVGTGVVIIFPWRSLLEARP